MNRPAKEGVLDRLINVKLPRSKSCLHGKATVKPFGKVSKASSPLKLMRHGANHFLTFIDDYSRYEYVYLLAHHYEAIDVFKHFVAEC